MAIAGDSITEQKQYSVFIEDYLLMCKPQADLRTVQLGWSGETSWGFLSKMPNAGAEVRHDGGDDVLRDERRRVFADDAGQGEALSRFDDGGGAGV